MKTSSPERITGTCSDESNSNTNIERPQIAAQPGHSGLRTPALKLNIVPGITSTPQTAVKCASKLINSPGLSEIPSDATNE